MSHISVQRDYTKERSVRQEKTKIFCIKGLDRGKILWYSYFCCKTKQSVCPLSPAGSLCRVNTHRSPGGVSDCTRAFGVRVSFYQSITWRCFAIASKELQVNEQIRDAEVRVIGEDGAQLGVMSARDAQKLADERDLDLVKIAPTAVPPVCKIMDFGKYRFEQAKREKEAKKNQHVTEIKEVRLGLNTDVGDFNTKVRHAIRFLQDGDRVKVSIRFRGRELGHPEIGTEAMGRFAEACKEFGTVDKPAKMEGRHMMMFLAPVSTK